MSHLLTSLPEVKTYFYICSYSWWAGPAYVVAQLFMSMCPIMLLKRSEERASCICLDSLQIKNRDCSYSRQQEWNTYRSYYLIKRSCRAPTRIQRHRVCCPDESLLSYSFFSLKKNASSPSSTIYIFIYYLQDLISTVLTLWVFFFSPKSIPIFTFFCVCVCMP